jgi:hypothetical protein
VGGCSGFPWVRGVGASTRRLSDGVTLNEVALDGVVVGLGLHLVVHLVPINEVTN